jgi:hypothetical protein
MVKRYTVETKVEDLLEAQTMSTGTGGQPLKVFQCPSCKEYINTLMKQCRFCHTPINHVEAQKATDLQGQENKLYRRHHYARHMKRGIMVFLAASIPTAVMLYAAFSSPTGGVFIILYGAIGGGLVDFLYGLVGCLEERKGRRNE